MRYSQIFSKTLKEAPKDEVAVNAQLLIRAGFIDKLMAGSYTLLHLGRRVEQKIEQIVREEINKTGAEEILMPLLHPKDIWNETERWDKADEVMYKLEKSGREYVLSFTHEEIVMDLFRKHISSYRDLPAKVYHFSTKFRSELRAKSGILRGREFVMKDLYSAHVSEEEFLKYYWEVADAYKTIFGRMGLEVKLTESGGGVFTDRITHEFQLVCETGEDVIFYCDHCDFCQNQEIAKVSEGDPCSCGNGNIQKASSVEVGNIFPLGTFYSEKMNVFFTDKDGKKTPVFFGSYGIGMTRMLGAIVEVSHDTKGMLWPEAVAPYSVHLIDVGVDEDVVQKAEKVYKQLQEAGIDVLYDDRKNATTGQKFSDADLIGIPLRLVISKKTGDEVEIKERGKDAIEMVPFDKLLDSVQSLIANK